MYFLFPPLQAPSFRRRRKLLFRITYISHNAGGNFLPGQRVVIPTEEETSFHGNGHQPQRRRKLLIDITPRTSYPVLRARTSYFVFRTSYFVLRISYFVLRTSYFVFRTSYFVLRTSYFVLRTSYFVFRSSYFLKQR